MLAIIYLGLICFIFLFELVRPKIKSFDYLTFFNIIFCVSYPFPGLLFTLTNINNLSSSILLGTTTDLNNSQVPLAIFLTYFIGVIGFYSQSAQIKAQKIVIEHRCHDNVIIVYILILLSLSCISIQIYSSQYGGLLSALSNAALIRAEVIEAGSFSFFKRFVFLCLFAAYLSASLLFIKKTNRKRNRLYILFLFSMITFLVSFLMIATRAVLLRTVITFYLVYVICRGRVSLKFMMIFIISSSLFVFYGKEIFGSLTALPDGFDAVIDKFQYFLDTKEKTDFSLNELNSEFTFPFTSIYAALNTVYEMRFLNDWLYGFASFLPDKLLYDLMHIEVPQTISYYNTYYIVKSNEYEIPSGFISSCFYSLSWPGVIIFSFSYGWLGRWLQTIFINHIKQIYWMPFIYVAGGLIWADFIPYADPKILLHTHFWFFISTLILFALATKISIQKNHYGEITRKKSENQIDFGEKTVLLHVITGLSTGGAEIMLYNLLSKSNRRRFQPIVVSLMDRGTLGDRIEELGIQVYCLNMKQGVPDLTAVWKLTRLIHLVKPSLIQGWMYHGNLAVQLVKALSFARIPILWGIHHSISSLSSEKKMSQLIIKIGARLSKSINQIIFVSKNSKFQHQALGYTRENSCIIPNGFDTSLFKPSIEARLNFRAELGLPADSCLIGSIARYHPMKDHANFIRAAALLTSSFPNLHFILVGTDVDAKNDDLYQLIQELGFGNQIHLLGERRDISRITPALDILCSSSAYGEAFPLVVGESMSCGVPCVVTDVGDSAWIVGNTGRVVPPKNPEALANACRKLILLGFVGRQKLGKMARARIIESFSLDSVVAQYEDLYEKLLAKA